MSLSKKTRFEVFKRDGFQCAYCGKTPPEVALEVDHVDPKSLGGLDDINNLITACFECNRGKRNIPLTKAPPTLSEKMEILKAKEDQLKEYRKYVKQIRKRIDGDISSVENVFQLYFENRSFTDGFRNSIRNFVDALDVHEIQDAMHQACLKINDPQRAIKYFCGICWNKIKNRACRND